MVHICTKQEKSFGTIKEAIEAVTKLSWSLGQSDLYVLSADTLEEAIKNIESYNEDIEGDQWNVPSLGALSTYDDKQGIVNTSEGGELNSIFYGTSTGTNQLMIRKLGESPDGKPEYDAIYRVESKNPFQESSAMKSFSDDGWDCRCISAVRNIAKSSVGIGSGHSLYVCDRNLSAEELEKLEECLEFHTHGTGSIAEIELITSRMAHLRNTKNRS